MGQAREMTAARRGEKARRAGKLSAIVLIGPTGSGKTPLGDYLERHGLKRRPCVHFDFGANLRRCADAEDFTPEERAVIRECLSTGRLLGKGDFRIAEKVFRKFADCGQVTSRDLVVMNGLPRHVDQAEDVDRVIDIGMVVYLRCDADVAFERIRLNSGGDRAGRVDDDFASVRDRLVLFENETVPVVDYYRRKMVKVLVVNVRVDTEPQGIWAAMEGDAAC